MKKIHCVICGKYRKFKNPKISYIFEKNISIICSKCKNEDEKIINPILGRGSGELPFQGEQVYLLLPSISGNI